MQTGDNREVRRTTLGSMLDQIDSVDDELTIYASKQPQWTEASEAIACREPDDGSLPSEALGLAYLLEVSLAKDAIRVWRAWRGNALPTSKEKCDAVIYYATNDSYLPA